jgi:hypothetical protein
VRVRRFAADRCKNLRRFLVLLLGQERAGHQHHRIGPAPGLGKIFAEFLEGLARLFVLLGLQE